MEVRESQIEDVFVSSATLSRSILHLEDEPRLLARQMRIPSGRLDLLYAYQTTLLLVELKVVAFQENFVDQLLAYKNDLMGYQRDGILLSGRIQPYLLCTFATEKQQRAATEKGIVYLDYDPEQVLQYFHDNLKPIVSFTEIKPIDIGIWNIHLVHDFIYFLEKTDSVTELRKLVKGSPKTLYNKIRFAHELRLVRWTPNQDSISLSELGRKYVKSKDSAFPERLAEAQVDLLRDFVMRNPFESCVILGIASIVEAVFALAKNRYPVLMPEVMEYFSYHAGKHFDWQTEKARYNGTRMYSNYAVNLGLLAKSGDAVYLTPEGFRFTIQMQLHKSLKMVDSMTFV